MKILLVSPLYPPYTRGGGGVVISEIALGLANRGHIITVLSGCYSRKPLTAMPHKESIGGIEIIWIPLLSIMKNKYPQLRASMLPNIPSLAFLKTLNYDSYDIIHLSAFGHMLIDYVNLLTKNQRKILTVHAFPKYVEKGGKASSPLKFLYRIYSRTLGKHTLKSARMITAISEFTLNEAIRRGVAKDQIKLIENGVDLEKFKPVKFNEFEERYNVESEDIVILSISRVTWHKGYEYAIEAIKTISKVTGKPIKYFIIDSIEDLNYYLTLEKQIQALSLEKSVKFTGFLSNNMKLQALSRSDIFLAPSLHEGFGLVILEAMALGKPIIASNCEGFRHIIEHMTNGLLVEPTSSNEIANSISLLLSNSSLRKKLEENALHNAKKYSWVERVKEYEEIYKEFK